MVNKSVLPIDSDQQRRWAEERLATKLNSTESSESEEDQLRHLHELHVQHIELEMQNSELKRLEQDLRQKEIELEEAQLLAGLGSWTYDPLIGKSTWSKGMFNIWGLDPALGLITVEIVQKYIHPADFSKFETLFSNAVINGVPYTVELRIIRPDGIEKTIISICEPLRDQDGNVVKLRGTNQDISDSKRSEELLRESQARFQAFYDLGLVGLTITSPDKGWIFVNNCLCNMLGYSEAELRKMTWAMLTHPEDLAADVEQFERLLAGDIEGYELEKRFLTRYNKVVFTKLVVRCVRKPDQTVDFIVAMVEDITERKQVESEKIDLEHQLLMSQKLESLGVLAGGIAHDFNNLLAVIIGNCSLAKLRPTKALDSIEPIEKAAQRAADLCQQMLAYAGKTQFVENKVKISLLVEEMIDMLKSSVGKNVEIISGLATDIPPIKGDASQIRQIVMNLIINASEAIGEEQGKVIVSLTKKVFLEGQTERDHLRRPIPVGRYACLEVTDSGCGMDLETINRIFEPFYTTKFTGRGLGMSAVLGIITAHKGALQLFSLPGKGSIFRIFLPIQAHDVNEDATIAQSDASESWKGNGTILLVEDEEQVMLVAKTMLEELGFGVVTAINGKQALELFQKNSAGFRLVVTDIGMPVMDGYALIRELKTLKPELPIIISTGFGDSDVTSRIACDAMSGLVCKPYDFGQFRDVLKNVVEVMPR